jgi:hypothetical protein
MTMTPYGHGLSMVPNTSKHGTTRYPVQHPDTGKLYVYGKPGLVADPPKVTNIPWWEPIQVKRDHIELLTRNWGWQLYGTGTFKDPIHPEAAHKTFRLFERQINEALFGKRHYKRKEGLLYARAEELQQRDVIHYHFLIAGVPEAPHLAPFVKQTWQKLAGHAKVVPFEPGRGGEQYLAKYVAKGGNLEYGGPIEKMPKS